VNILAINPGATSTKFAVYEDERPLFEHKVEHRAEDLKPFAKVFDQYDFRLSVILGFLKEKDFDLSRLDAVAARGGLLKPVEGGTYLVNEAMLADLGNAIRGEHASNLGAVLAYNLGRMAGAPAYIVDPVAVDEFDEVARVSGIPELRRESLLHALNHKAVARKVASSLGGKYEEMNFVVAHLGTGTSIAAHRKGRAVDVEDARGEGPFSLDRSGGLNAYEVVKLCFSGRYTEKEMKEKLGSKGGIYAYFGTKDIREVEKLAASGDGKAKLVLDAMIYQIAKEIGAQATVLCGKVDRIILTGGIAFSKPIVGRIEERVGFIAPVVVVPGEEELQALALGALRVLSGGEPAKEYR